MVASLTESYTKKKDFLRLQENIYLQIFVLIVSKYMLENREGASILSHI